MDGLWRICLDTSAELVAGEGLEQYPYEYLMEDILTEAKAKRQGRDLCLFCMGKIGQVVLPYFKNYFHGQLKYVSDNDLKKWGGVFEGVECLPPDRIPQNACVFIALADINNANDIYRQLKALGINEVHYFTNVFGNSNEQ